MEASPANWVISTQALLVAITGLIVAIPPLIVSIVQLLKEPPRSGDHDVQKPKTMRLTWPAVLCLCLLTGALSLLGARLFTKMRLPVNAKLANQAWNALVTRDYRRAFQTASDCVNQFGGQADVQQAKLMAEGTPIPPVGNVSHSEKTVLLGRGVLNDVGACLFVEAQAAEKMGNADGARSAYQSLSRLTYARIYDPAGFFWSPAEAASARLQR
jgi:hypothetical protein